jgi:hypothetical protein
MASNVKDRLTLTGPTRGGRGNPRTRGRGRSGGRGRGGRLGKCFMLQQLHSDCSIYMRCWRTSSLWNLWGLRGLFFVCNLENYNKYPFASTWLMFWIVWVMYHLVVGLLHEWGVTVHFKVVPKFHTFAMLLDVKIEKYVSYRIFKCVCILSTYEISHLAQIVNQLLLPDQK